MKRIEDVLEVYHNSGQFRYSLAYLLQSQQSPFDFFRKLSDYYKRNGLDGLQFKRLDRYNILRDFSIIEMKQRPDWKLERMENCLLHDLYLRENLKKRPDWAKDYTEQKKAFALFFRNAGYTGKQMHLEPQQEQGGRFYLLYDYEHRNPLDSSAAVRVIGEQEFQETVTGNKGRTE